MNTTGRFPTLKLCHCWCDFPLSIWWDNPPSYTLHYLVGQSVWLHGTYNLVGQSTILLWCDFTIWWDNLYDFTLRVWWKEKKKKHQILQCMILYVFSKLCCLLGVGFWWAIFQVELLASHSWQNCFQDSAPEQYHLLLMHSPSPFSILQHCLSTILKHISL